ncbi:proline dehydrogenase 1, mitochondrial-like [Homalodisca vitripennis]|uniref:proline dehydrogenase 1, mitochondrial-like n=1 Tax=Homalodisca vitripennis TaxID=197043 RepID=UPI001EEBFBE2|nr:proline dehydrogenase 1, mitochondrial-like [Homalodisca vitripennis]XP_046688838.1 proline dehydrogenase 1, mitochondrial-like [Homalodisca vitripennis]XP_046688839.1 proline dehydrogenase 1, mitochondrial-like [Homalodisca vitripennis]
MKMRAAIWSIKNSCNLQYARQNTHCRKQLLSDPLHLQSQAFTVIRNKSTVTSSVGHETKVDALDTRFSDPESAFRSKTTWEVLRALIVYQMCSVNFIVDNNAKLIKLCQSVLGKRIFGMLMKATFYGHFVAGENEEKIAPTLKRLYSFGVKPILDYSVEEDISHEEAEKLEMDASQSEREKTGQPSEADEMGGKMPQYHAHKSFADRRYKVSSARTYFYLNEATCEKNLEIFQNSLLAVANHTQGTGITAVKLTALGRPQLLLQLSEVIMRARNFVSQVMGGRGNVLGHHFTAEMLEKKLKDAGITDTAKFLEKVVTDKHGVIHLFPWSGIVNENYELSDTFRVPSLKEGRMVRLISQLSPQEEAMFRNMVRRMNTLVATAKDLNVRLMVDAEQTYFQPAISRITLEMMNKYNTDKAIVFNTYQCYLKEAFNEVSTDLEQAKRQNFYFGAKLVRGAYIDQERERAAELNYPDPINPTYEATSESYHKTLTECLSRIKALKDAGEPNKIAIMVASHNEDTVRFAIDKMKEIGVLPQDKVICFGQLYGMCDFITFPLGQAGYSAYKYIPYGPVNEVLPYLSRRATENKSVLKKLQKEKKLLRTELLRRIAKGKIFYKPVGNYTPA